MAGQTLPWTPFPYFGSGPPTIPGTAGRIYYDQSTTPPSAYVYVSGVGWFAVSGPAAGGVQSTLKLTLSSAQVRALFTTPINLIPAPTAGQLVIVDRVTYKGTGAYTQAAGAGLVYHGTTTGADYAYANAVDPFINGTYLSAGVAPVGSLATELGLGVDVAAITTNPTVGTTPVLLTVNYRVLTP